MHTITLNLFVLNNIEHTFNQFQPHKVIKIKLLLLKYSN